MLADNIITLNETILACLQESDETRIVKSFVETGCAVLGADFGFVWLNSFVSQDLRLVYQSPSLPFIPHIPRKGGKNYTAIKSGLPLFISNVKKVPDALYVSKYLESFVIIPLVYKEVVYGTMVFCFKKAESFPKEKKALCTIIGNTVAQTITISRFISSEHEAALVLAKHKVQVRMLEEEKFQVESIADATHELRTPLAVIRGNVDLVLQSKKKNPNTALRAIDKEVQHLSTILADLALLTSQGGDFKNRINTDKVDMHELLTTTVQRLKNISYAKNISISTDLSKNISLHGDRVYLEKLFSNLIRNAITYGKENGWIKVTMLKKPRSIQIEISDNGIGISKEDLPHIFNRFYRSDKSHNSNGKRTGLGLAIAKWVTTVHGGSLSVNSTLGKGSTFTVTLPLKKL